ncbi:MAG TPA: TonB-dependent receptor [Bacteroidales bacterium]|nr:TonB-dependent receptor [Bacteroidales bacterium]HPS16035.1 TonB-dependent receptor [Bacteroidales bacterium]
MKFFYSFLFFITLSAFTNAQKTAITGKVIDSKTKEPLVGVTVVADDINAVSTDINGFYTLVLIAGNHTIAFKYIGYTTEIKKISIKEGELQTINISVTPSLSMLDEIVVSAGKFEQKMSDVTVSIQTIKPSMIENNNTNSIETIINKTPGVIIMDDQASIRGGSGYSYGAGSRVLLLVDDLPMLSGDAGDVKWDFAPVENIEQIEVIKGASSALYGSSALNGIINIRTAYPGNKPQTKIIVNTGLYNNPRRKEIIWWGTAQPIFAGTQFLHSRKIGNFDLSVGANLFSDQGYRENNNRQRCRFNINTRYRDKKIKGLSYGLNANMMNVKGNEFLLWHDGDSGVYRPSENYSQQMNNSRLNIDPYIVYYNDKGNRHSLKSRFYQINNNNNTNQSTRTYLFYGEYQFQKHFKKGLTITTGLSGTYNYAVSDLYGNKNHYVSSEGLFAQFDKKINLFTLSLGVRYEIYKMDQDQDNSKPVFRTGLNYELTKSTFLRGSFGQGFRYPSIAEKYITSSVGTLKIFPNDYLRPETGWSAEIGFKQGFKISSWFGYIDVAGYWTQYHDMIEFTFGQHYPDSLNIITPTYQQFIDYTGFKAYNISNAQINGIDITMIGEGIIFGLPTTIMAGYTYTNPTDLDIKRDSLKSGGSNVLKYRFYHSAKIDFEISYNKITADISMNYHSFMINIDKAFEDTLRSPNGTPLYTLENGIKKYIMFLPGLKEYRNKHHTGDIVFDARISYQFTEESKISVIAKNVFNREYMLRPGDVQPPRSIAIQYTMKF